MDTSDTGLWQEIQDATKLRKEYLDLYTERLLKLTGNKYRTSWKVKAQLENYAFGYMAFTLPQLVFDKPVVQIDPMADARDTVTAEGTQSQINQFIQCSHYKERVLIPCARDMLLGWAVTQTLMDLSSREAQRGQPVISKQIPIGQYVCDAQCFGYLNRRWEGHAFDKPKDQVLNDPRYAGARAIIEPIAPNDSQRDRDDQPVQREVMTQRKDMLTLWEIYLVDTQEIVTMVQTADNAGVTIRREPYNGPPEGPYTLWGCYEVSGQIYPFSPLAATEEQQDDLNDHAGAHGRAARTYKRFTVGQKGQEADAKAVQTVKSGQMVLLSAPGSVADHETGGASDVQTEVLALLRDRLDRNLGFSDAQRGQPNANTATANNLAQNNADLRTGFLLTRLTDCCETDLRKVGWYFYNKTEIVQDLIIENAQGQKESYTMLGGPTDPQELAGYVAAGMADPSQQYNIGKEWVDYHLKIQVESMVKVADPIRQKRAQDEMALATNMATVIGTALGPQAALAAINWRRLARRYGQAFNESQFDMILFTEAFDQMVAPDRLAMMGMGQPPMAQPGVVQPSLPALPASPQTPIAPAGQSSQQSPATLPGMMQNASAGVGASAF